jgi:molybdate transport system regulatory protein
MEFLSSFTMEISDQPFLLEKRIKLLEAISREGSILKAAKAVPMSYKAAWEAVDAMNNLSHTPIVVKETGGKGGGGTKLTEYGENLIKTYTVLKQEQTKFLKMLNEMTDVDTGTLKTIGRLAMQISARNQLSGIVDQIEKGTVNSQVYIKLKSGDSLVSVITNNGVELLGIELGDEVTTIFKSSSVLLSSDKTVQLSAQNQLEGTIDSLTIGTVNTEVVINVGNNDKVVAIVTSGAVKSLGLEVGGTITAVIKSSDIMIGK